MATNNKRFVAKNGLDNNNQTITNLGASGNSLGLSGTGDLTIAISGTATITLPAGNDTLVTLTGSQVLTNKTLTSPIISSISNTGTLTLPTSTDTLVGRATSDTLTNKTISGADNTLSNIGNASLSNSTISGVSLGGNLADLTVGTGVSLNSGTTYNGGTAKTVSIGQAVGTGDNVTFAGVTADNVRIGVTAAAEIDTSAGNLTIDSTGGTTVMDDDVNVTGNLQIDGNLTVSGTTVTINATNLAVEDNMIYLNNGSTVTHPDLGFAGNYNDGTYRHAGLFRDESDGVWKFFHQYTPEPDASAYIDITHASFALAPLQVSTITGTLVGAAPAGSLTGTTLASNVVNSSLTSVGTLTNLTVSDPSPFFNTGDAVGTLTLGTTAAVTREQRFRLTNSVATGGVELVLNGAATSWGLYDRTASKWAIQIARGATDAVSILGSLAVTSALSTSSTLQASSYAAVGGAVSANVQLYVRGTIVGTGVNQYAALMQTTFPVAATSSMQGLYVQSTGAAGTYTTTDVVGVNVQAFALGAGQTVTNGYGVFIGASSHAATTKYGIQIGDVTGGTTNYALYTGTGLVRFGDAVSALSSLTVSGDLTVDTNTLKVDSANNRVGIGTASPATLLDINGATTFRNTLFLASEGILSWSSDLGNGQGGLVIGSVASKGVLLRGGASGTGIFLNSSNNVGIGTTSPDYRLTVLTPTSDATVGFNLRAYTTGADGDRTTISRYTSSNNNNWAWHEAHAWAHIWKCNGVEQMRLTSGGNVGIGTTNPGSYKLQVQGDTYVTGTLTEGSSIALKKNINPITDALNIINNLTGYTFDRTDSDATNQAGLIAEEVAEVLPGVVSRDQEGNPNGVQYTKIIAYLVESIKELKSELDELKRQ